MTITFDNLPDNVDIYVNGVPMIIQGDMKTQYTVTDVFEHYYGTKEYQGIVPVIQEWFYGSVRQTAWCATAMCWALAQLGLLGYTLNGEKYDNVYKLKQALDDAFDNNRIDKVSLYEARYGDIVILCFDNKFTPDASKHVTSISDIEYAKYTLECLGGNQKDGIFYSLYDTEDVIAVYRPHYEVGNIKDLTHLPEV